MRFHRVLLVVNPVARTVAKPTLAVIEKALSADFALEVAETKEKGHASELAAQAVHDGIDLVVVFSGDGTINEAVNALAGTQTALAVLPGGATNVLVRALGLPTDPVECTGTLIPKALDDEAFPLHLGRADGRYFAVNCGAGIDCRRDAPTRRKYPDTKAKFDRARSARCRGSCWSATRASRRTSRLRSTARIRCRRCRHGRATVPYTFYKDRGSADDADASLERA
jgi:diacylglycerol kinase family enzyme